MGWRQSRLGRLATVQPRLVVSVLVGVALGWLLPPAWLPQTLTRWLLAWNVGTVLYAALATAMMLRSTQDLMRRRARVHDEGSG